MSTVENLEQLYTFSYIFYIYYSRAFVKVNCRDKLKLNEYDVLKDEEETPKNILGKILTEYVLLYYLAWHFLFVNLFENTNLMIFKGKCEMKNG